MMKDTKRQLMQENTVDYPMEQLFAKGSGSCDFS